MYEIKMLLIKSKPTTPTKRWMLRIFLQHSPKPEFTSFFKYKVFSTKLTNRSVGLSGLKKFKKKVLYKYCMTKLGTFPLYACYFGYSKYPLREFIFAKSIYNHCKLFLNTEMSYPGFKFFPDTSFMPNASQVNQLISLSEVPLTAVISYVFNFSNLKITFACSSGVRAIRRKNLKKSKLVYVELPSERLVLLPASTHCYLTSVKNIFLNKIILGKWGSLQKNKRRLHVRGVAKNPVDHPNGGRTKAKQPELSPWGWIAKKSK